MGDRTLNILFLGGGKRVSLAEHFIKRGQERGLTVNIFSYELDGYVPVAAVAKIITGLKWKDTNILPHLLETIRTNDIHMVLPFVDPAIVLASRLAHESPGTFIPVSGEEICKIMFDKVAANSWFISKQFPVPANSFDRWPLIAKPRFGSASKGLLILNDENAYTGFKQQHNEDDYLVQQFIHADEYTVDCYIDKTGKVVASVPRKRLEVSGGEAVKSITEKDSTIMEIARRILVEGHFKGPVTIQFLKERASGNVFVMEINPRFGGGVLTSIAAGADMVQYLLNDYEGIPNEPCSNWSENLLMVRAFREFYFYANNN